MSDELERTSEELEESSVEETGSEESQVDSGSVDDGADFDEAQEQDEIDYRELYERERSEREELASLMGRQANELGELRKMVEGSWGTDEDENNPAEYFDEDTRSALDKYIAEKAAEQFQRMKEAEQQQILRAEFGKVVERYEIGEQDLPDIAMYADRKNVSLSKAAEALSNMGIINRKTNGATSRRAGGSVDLDTAPRTGPKVRNNRVAPSRDPNKMTTEEWGSLPEEKRMALLREVSPE
jgi:hypothetical protein